MFTTTLIYYETRTKIVLVLIPLYCHRRLWNLTEFPCGNVLVLIFFFYQNSYNTPRSKSSEHDLDLLINSMTYKEYKQNWLNNDKRTEQQQQKAYFKELKLSRIFCT